MTYDELLEAVDSKASYWHRKPLREIVEMCKPSDWDNDDSFYWKKELLETIERNLR